MSTLAKLHLDASPTVWGHRVVVAATLAGWLVLVGLVASMYVGHAPSPYGMCTTPSGHSVACAMLKRSPRAGEHAPRRAGSASVSMTYRIEPLPGYTPTIGRLVGMLLYARRTTLAAVAGLSIAELDHLHDDASNSIGALLAHVAVVERAYHRLTFDEWAPTAEETAAWEPALTLGAEGRRLLRGKPLEHYVQALDDARRVTLAGLAARDDEWLERSLRAAPLMNGHWAWFHVAEDEINHRGQMRWLRARLPFSPTSTST